MKKIAIVGSTGSIGTQTLDVVRANGDIEVLGISAGRNVKMLEEQAREFHPKLIAVWDENAAKDLAVRLQDMDVKIVSGMDGLLELARMPETDILVTAVVGMIGIRPTMEGIKAGKDIALANKETLVTAGHLIIPMAKEYGVQILPVDSEHSAIFQALHGEKREQVEKLLITASGGPFRGRKRDELKNVTLADTLKHPNWVMGQKITVDSATLVNKGLEVMEAIEVLKGNVGGDLLEVSLTLGANMLLLAERVQSEEEGKALLLENIRNGKGLAKFKELLIQQGGDVRVIADYSLLPLAEEKWEVKATKSGYLTRVDTAMIGRASQETGAGRMFKGQPLDFGAGIVMKKRTGDVIATGEALAVVYSKSREKCQSAADFLQKAITIEAAPLTEQTPLILKTIRQEG